MWKLAWAKFDGMYKNLPQVVDEQTVADFHFILDLLQEASGEDLSTFRVPASRINPRLTSANYRTGRQTFSSESYCDRAYVLTQMDSVRGYFTNLQPPPTKPHIGL